MTYICIILITIPFSIKLQLIFIIINEILGVGIVSVDTLNGIESRHRAVLNTCVWVCGAFNMKPDKNICC